MGRSASGSRCRRNSAPPLSNNVAGCTRPPTCSLKLPKSLQGRAKEMLRDVSLAPARQDALAAYDRFLSKYQLKYPKACHCLERDKGVLFTFYDFPAEHWSHLRTTNPIESTFATVRLRTQRRDRVHELRH